MQTSTVDPLDLEALARVVESELGSGSLAERLVIAYTVVNRARSERKSIHALEAPGGAYGPQQGKRPFSSAQAPSPRSQRLAAWVLLHPSGLPAVDDSAAVRQALRAADTTASEAQLVEAAALFRAANQEPTGGAWAFWEPGIENELTRRGQLYRAAGGRADDKDPAGGRRDLFRFRRYFKTAAEVRAKWRAGRQLQLATVGRIELWSAPGSAAR